MEASNSSGVKVMSIAGRMAEERERLIGMTDEERAWRARFVKSQVLAPDEPLPETKRYYRGYYNPIRRIYRFPLDCLQNLLNPVVGKTPAAVIRYSIAKSSMLFAAIYIARYYYKYNTHTWEVRRGWRVAQTRKVTLPGTVNYKGLPRPTNFASYGFENSPI